MQQWQSMLLQTQAADKAKRKTESLRNEVASLEAAVQAASQEYNRVKQRNSQVTFLAITAVRRRCQVKHPYSSCYAIKYIASMIIA